MMRRCLVHVLLSLLLLVSQQMAYAHALSHTTGKLGSSGRAVAAAMQDAGGDKDFSASVAQDGSCSHCLAFAQIAGAIGPTLRQFVPLDLRDERVAALATTSAARRTDPVFRSRAPPPVV